MYSSQKYLEIRIRHSEELKNLYDKEIRERCLITERQNIEMKDFLASDYSTSDYSLLLRKQLLEIRDFRMVNENKKMDLLRSHQHELETLSTVQ